tara:strand:- start:1996 stop:2331 length:336 start_codon:yes stop_codon:yes gene_type:complete
MKKELKNNYYNLPNDHSYTVYCMAYHDEGDWEPIEISQDFYVYPCCMLHGRHQLEKTYNDEYLDSLDKNFNNLEKNNMKDIMKFWRNYIKPEFFEDLKKLPNCCKKACMVK